MKFKKSLGQNLLIDKNIIKKIVKVGNLNLKSHVLEIGSGTGNLTREILSYSPKKMWAIEKDYQMYLKLNNDNMKNNSFKIFNEDALKFDEKKLLAKNIIVFGNLPYNISTQLLIKWIMSSKWLPWYSCLILMFQKEVADRIIGKVNSNAYGRLSIMANFRLKIKKEFDVSKNCFFPKPKVDSSVISFYPIKNIIYKSVKMKNLEFITRNFFSNRRKMIRKKYYKIFKTNEVKNALNLDLSLRPENLNPEIYYKLSSLL